LDQSFNSIDAQRESGLSYVMSQRQEGWTPVQDTYEDPGYSGGNMERPGLKRLMVDIQSGLIDMVVIYKIDRLSRSLTDFAKMVEIFDKHKVSFSSVTQQINSSTSTGRLMLIIRPVRARGDGRAYPRQDCGIQAQGAVDGWARSSGLSG
jgi:DNA invertase Pin-like site-specific DNA recombinase